MQDCHLALRKPASIVTVTVDHDYTLQRLAYVYRAKKEVGGSKLRVIWGSV